MLQHIAHRAAIGTLSNSNVQVGGLQQLKCLLGVISRPQQQQQHCSSDLAVPLVCSSSSRTIVTSHTHIPKAKQDTYRTPPRNYVQLLQHIIRSRDVSGLSRLVKQYGKMFDAVHVAAAMDKMPKLYQPPPLGGHLNPEQLKDRKRRAAKLMSHLQVTAASQVPRMFAPQVAMITNALSRCSNLLPGGTAANPTTQQLLDSMLSRMTQDNARLLWQGAQGASVSVLMQALARMGYSSSKEEGAASAAAAARQTTQQLCRIIAKDPERLHVRQLATAAWALGRMSRRHPQLKGKPAVAAALQTISRQAVARKLWLRPHSMTGLLTASVWLGHNDVELFDAVCEEAALQVSDMRAPQLAACAWALSKLDYTPPEALTAGLVKEARKQLQHFSGASLGLLLQGLQGLGALDRDLLAAVAAGIAAEERVELSPRQAVRILAAFVAEPTAGSARDVERMAQLIAAAVSSDAVRAPASIVTDLLVVYSKLQQHHPMLLRLLQEPHGAPEAFTLRQWVKMLQSAARLGYGQPVADADLEYELRGVYAAAEERLTQHVVKHMLGGTAEVQQYTGVVEEKGLPGKLRGAARKMQGWLGRSSWQQDSEAADQGEQQQQQPGQEARRVVELTLLLAQRGCLSQHTAINVSKALTPLLPQLSSRLLVELLIALTGREQMLMASQVKDCVRVLLQELSGRELSRAANTDLLCALLQPLSRAIHFELLAGPAKQRLMQGMYAQLLPVLEGCSQQQLLLLARALAIHPDGQLQARAEQVAARNGWQFTSSSLADVDAQ